MSEAESGKTDLPSIISPGMLVLVVGLIGYLITEPPLTSNRPGSDNPDMPPPPAPTGLASVHARLWDDPLAVAWGDHQRALSEKREPTRLLSRALGLDSSTAQWNGLLVARRTLQETDQKNTPTARSPGKFLCLPVLVPGEPYADDAERRRRITYAVLSALKATDFNLTYPDRLSYVTLPVNCVDRATDESIKLDLVVPVKLFQKARRGTDNTSTAQGPPEAVLVCWINESQLGARPLAVIGQVVAQLFKPGESSKEDLHTEDLNTWLALHIIGPSSSDVLVEMAEEDAAWDKSKQLFSKFMHPTLYSGLATVSSKSIARPKSEGDGQVGGELDRFTSGEATNTGLHVIRTIGTDELLFKTLAKELWLRGGWPGLSDPTSSESSTGESLEPGKYVVLVSEIDTLFGQTLPQTFRDTFPRVFKPKERREEDPLQVFGYLRGIDGKLPDSRSADPNAKEKTQQSDVQQLDPLRMSSRPAVAPHGRSQVDYLRRLERRLVRFHEQKRASGEDGIVAVGIVGTDVYDKLLLFRALRERFPEACFFTTDCDSALSLEEEYPSTRNVVVASHFALELHPDLQRGIPVFRDSYQTATYFQCLLALGDARIPKDLEDDPWRLTSSQRPSISHLEPLAFEVARHGLYQLTVSSGRLSANSAVHPTSHREHNWILGGHRIFFALTACLSLLWILSRFVTLVRTAFWPCLAGVVVIAGIFVLALIDHKRPNGEPFELFDGISIWPPTLIRAIDFMLALFFLYKARKDVAEMGAIHDRLLLSAQQNAQLHEQPAGGETGLGRLLQEVVVPGWPNSNATASSVYLGYRKRGRQAYRLLRSVGMWLVYLVFGFALWKLGTSSPNTPARGEVAWLCATAALLLAVLSMGLLTFYAYDAMNLCRRFIKGVASGRPDWSRDADGMMDMIQSRKPISEDDARELLSIGLIAEETQVVGKLVTYPFWAVFLLIVSRHPSFDFFDFPWPLLLFWSLSLLGTILFAGSLRWAADRARNEVLGRLRIALEAEMGGEGDRSKARIEQLHQFIADVKREQRGAFRPFVHDPIITALATLLGGTGGFMLIEQLLPYK